MVMQLALPLGRLMTSSPISPMWLSASLLELVDAN
jgi:hypothetical protein